jgi:hypothetical protein
MKEYVRPVSICVLLARIARSETWEDGRKVDKIKQKARRKKHELINSRY